MVSTRKIALRALKTPGLGSLEGQRSSRAGVLSWPRRTIGSLSAKLHPGLSFLAFKTFCLKLKGECSALQRYSRLASAAMELYNASSQGLVYRVSKQGRTSEQAFIPPVKNRVRNFGTRQLLTPGSTSLKRSG